MVLRLLVLLVLVLLVLVPRRWFLCCWFLCCWFLCCRFLGRLLRRCFRLWLPLPALPQRAPRPRAASAGASSASACRLLGRSAFALLLELADPRVDHADQLAHRGCEQPDDGGERPGERAHELRAQYIRRRQLGQLLDVVGADLGALEETAADDEDLRLRRVVERLRDRDGVAAGLEERDRGRPVEQREQRVDTRRLRGALRERVLDDREAGAVLEQLSAQVADLVHRQAAVVGDDQRLGATQPLRQLGDQAFFVRSVHPFTSLKRNRPASRRVGREADASSNSTAPRLDFRPRGLPAVFGDGLLR